MQLKIRGVKVYVLGRLGPNCKSVYVLIDFPQDPAFLLRVYTLGPLKTMLIQDKTQNIEQLSLTSIIPQILVNLLCGTID